MGIASLDPGLPGGASDHSLATLSEEAVNMYCESAENATSQTQRWLSTLSSCRGERSEARQILVVYKKEKVKKL